MTGKEILQQANVSVAAGDNEGFLKFCTDDTVWHFIGERTLHGKQAVSDYIAETYNEPPVFQVDQFIEDEERVVAVGKISLKGLTYDYCDVWKLKDGKLHELSAFVIKAK